MKHITISIAILLYLPLFIQPMMRRSMQQVTNSFVPNNTATATTRNYCKRCFCELCSTGKVSSNISNVHLMTLSNKELLQRSQHCKFCSCLQCSTFTEQNQREVSEIRNNVLKYGTIGTIYGFLIYTFYKNNIKQTE